MATPEGPEDPTVGDGPRTVTLVPGSLPGLARERRSLALERGSPVGRYLVLERIGAGGMGEVFSGYDPELDRKVALKLLHPEEGRVTGAIGATRSEARLLREAQAIARLSHPNVVGVFDVGTYGDEVFIAMELIAGQTLRSWLSEEQRPWREILKVFLAAGEGLAAAHGAGLAHRDFKPENVLIGENGAVKVVDFGLARALATGGDRPGGASGEDGAGDRPIARERPTEWGHAAGTPAYMSPEQRRGLPADARSDQYSYCVALWEALHGALPAAPHSVSGGLRSLWQGRKESGASGAPGARTGSGPPAWLRGVLERGLAASPEARFPSFRELLTALNCDPLARRRNRLLAAATVAALSALAAGLWIYQAHRSQLCRGGEAEIAKAWNPERRTALRSAFAATGLAYAAESAEVAVAALDRYAGEWARGHRSTCEATRLRGEQSEEMLDRRMLCLGQRRDELGALAALLARAEPPVVARAARAAASLSDLRACTDSSSLAEVVPLPHDAALRRRVATAERRLAEVKALQVAGKPREALPLARSLWKVVETIPYAPLQARASFRLADLLENTGDFRGAEEELHRSLALAEEGRDDLWKAEVWRKLAYTVGYRLARYDEGRRQIVLAKAALRRGGGDAGEEGAVLNAEGGILFGAGRLEEADRVYARAAALGAQTGRPDVTSLANRAAIAQIRGDLGRALALGREQLAATEKSLGNSHPNMAVLRFNLAGTLSDAGRTEEADAEYRRSLALRERLFGPEHVDVAESLAGLASNWIRRGEPARALPLLERALAIYAKDDSDTNYEAFAYQVYGEALGALGRFAEGERRLEEAVELFGRASGPESVYASQALLQLAVLRIERGHASRALPLLERIEGMVLKNGENGPPWMRDAVRFRRAQARWEAGLDRAGAMRAARSARGGLAAGGAAAHGDLAAADRWLVAREKGTGRGDG